MRNRPNVANCKGLLIDGKTLQVNGDGELVVNGSGWYMVLTDISGTENPEFEVFESIDTQELYNIISDTPLVNPASFALLTDDEKGIYNMQYFHREETMVANVFKVTFGMVAATYDETNALKLSYDSWEFEISPDGTMTDIVFSTVDI